MIHHIRLTPADRVQRLATFARAARPDALVLTLSGFLSIRYAGIEHRFGNCPTFRQVREVLGLPTEFITLEDAR